MHELKPCGEAIETGPWDDGSTARFTPMTDGHLVGYKCEAKAALEIAFTLGLTPPEADGGSS